MPPTSPKTKRLLIMATCVVGLLLAYVLAVGVQGIFESESRTLAALVGMAPCPFS